MNIFGYKLSKQVPEPIMEAINMASSVSSTSGGDSIDTIKLSVLTDLPMIGHNRTEPWVNYGSDNLYPEFLKDLYNTSPTHNAIVKTKAQMVVGEGSTYDDINYDENDKINIVKVLNHIDKDNI